jgi:hypothetical protein
MMLYNRTPLKPAAVQPRKIVLYLELGDFPGRSIPKPLLGLEELHLASARSGAGSCNSPASKRAILTGPTGTSFHQANSSGGKARWPAIGANRAPVCQPYDVGRAFDVAFLTSREPPSCLALHRVVSGPEFACGPL